MTAVETPAYPVPPAANVVACTEGMTREDWLAARRTGIGGSDAATVCGLNRWKSPPALWLEKRGEIDETEAGEAAEWGNLLEAAVADEFARRSGVALRRYPYMLAHRANEWQHANIDRVVVEAAEMPDGTPYERIAAGYEGKVVGHWMVDDWTDTPPVYVQLQCQHYMAVTGLPRWHVAALLEARELRTYVVEADQEDIDLLIAEEWRFMQGLRQGVMPPVDGHRSTTEALAKRYGLAVEGAEALLPHDAELVLDERARAKALIKDLEGQVAALDNQLKLWLGEATEGRIGGEDRPAVTWRPEPRRRIDLDQLREEFPDAAATCTKTEITRTLRVPSRKGRR